MSNEIVVVGKIKRKPIQYEIKNECWICISHSRSVQGYPRIVINNKSTLMSRYIYERFIGKIPKGLCILHSCDNPNCINPSHFKIGTNLDNVIDKVNKGRQSILAGEKGANHKLIQIQVDSIRNDTRMNTVIAKEYEVCKSTIGRIKNNKSWVVL